MADVAAARTKSRRFGNNPQKSLRWSPNVRDSTNATLHHRERRKVLKTSVLSSSSPTPRSRNKQPAGYHLFVESPDKKRKSALPRWLVSCKLNTEDYHVESWVDFHKKHGSHSYRNGRSMTFAEIRKQQRQKVTPSLTQRIVQRLVGQPSKCPSCGSTQCDSSCSIYSTPSSTDASKKKRMSPFRTSTKK